jgi:excisionase family DNA binding protein
LSDDVGAQGARAKAVEKYYTVQTVAYLLQLHVQTVRDDIRRGNLEVTRFGPRRTRISTSQYAAYLEWLKDPANWS